MNERERPAPWRINRQLEHADIGVMTRGIDTAIYGVWRRFGGDGVGTCRDFFIAVGTLGNCYVRNVIFVSTASVRLQAAHAMWPDIGCMQY